MSGLWPDDIRCVVMLTVDVDGVSGLINRYPDAPKHPSLMSLGEFGPSVGAPRLLDLFARFGIKSSFFVPGYVAERYPALVARIVEEGHELGHHGYLHEPPGTLSKEEEETVLDRGIEVLSSLTGEVPRGYRSPAWELSAHTLDLLAARGFAYDTSLVGGDAPYFVSARGHRMVELPTQWFLDDHPYFVYLPPMTRLGRLPGVEEVFENWKAEFDGAYRYGRSVMITMHPRQSGRLQKVVALEKLIAHMRSFPGVAFMRCIDVADLWARRQADDRERGGGA